MTTYKPFPHNRDVMDVLACIIRGKSTSKEIVKELKQPQSTVATKLKFLVNNKVVIKDKWVFRIDWKELNKIFSKKMKGAISGFIDDKKKVNEIMRLFDDKRKRSILETYSYNVDIFGRPHRTITEIAFDYLIGLSQTSDKDLKKLDKKFIELRDHITFESPQKYLFIETEEIGLYVGKLDDV